MDWEAEARKSWCSRMWRAKWNLIPRGPTWLPEIIRLTWYLQIIGFVIGLHTGIDGTLFQPFFFSRTSCCGESGTPKELPSKYDFKYPDTLIYCASCIFRRETLALLILLGVRVCLLSDSVHSEHASERCM